MNYEQISRTDSNPGQPERILARQLAHELTSEEVEQVSGAQRPVGTWSSCCTGCACDCVWDPMYLA